VGVDKDTVSRCIQRVSHALAAKTDQFIKWPSDQRKREIKQGFHESGGFPGVIECVNGNHVRITAPNVITFNTNECYFRILVFEKLN
jgi:hypothetical protein